VTGQYELGFCPEAGAESGLAAEDASDGVQDCEMPYQPERSSEQQDLSQDRARLPSIRDIVLRSSLGRFQLNPDAGANESDYFRVNSCSSRTGYTSDAQTGVPAPRRRW
jgi:hypothetical protein